MVGVSVGVLVGVAVLVGVWVGVGVFVGVAVGGTGVLVGVAVGPPAAKLMTSWGRLLPFSRLWNCCSASLFSEASRIRKPLLVPALYMACTWVVTFHCR